LRILILNGPNLDLLGVREPDLYGSTTLPQVEAALKAAAATEGVDVRCAQSNHEGALIEHLHDARKDCDGVIINPAGYGHTSVALRDALIATDLPAVEVHLTNLARRESFRHHTLTADVAIGQICGFGVHGYHLALTAIIRHLHSRRTP